MFYALDVTVIKLSILLLYLRLFKIDKELRMLCYGMMAFVVAWAIAVVFTLIFQCHPIAAAWNKTIPGAVCFNIPDYIIGSGVPNILADVVIIGIPIPLLWKLQISKIRRLGIIALFLVAAMWVLSKLTSYALSPVCILIVYNAAPPLSALSAWFSRAAPRP